MLVELYWYASWYGVRMVTPSKWSWCCVCWLYFTKMPVDMVCIWWHHSSGGGVVVSDGCTVLSCKLIWCMYVDTIQVEVVFMCLLVALYLFASWYAVCMLKPSNWRCCCCVCWLQYTELRVDMMCVWLHYLSGGGAVVSAGWTVVRCQLICCVYGFTIQVEVVLMCLLVVIY